MSLQAFPLPPDLAGQQSGIDRKRQLAEMLMKQAMTPQQGQMVSGHYVKPGVGSMLGQVASLFMGQKMQGDLDQQQRTIGESYNKQLGAGLEKYFKTREGAPGQTLSDQQAGDLMNNDQAPPPLAEPVKADPRRAMLEAMTSGLQPLQEIGKMELAASLKQGRDPSMIKESGGQFFDLSSGKPVLLGGVEYGPTERIGGDLYQRGPGGKLVKLDNSTKVTTNVNNMPAAAGLKKYQEALGESLAPGGQSRAGADQAQEGLNASVEALQAVNNGARQGIAQPAMQVVRKLAAELGVTDAATAPTDALSAALKQSIFKDLGGLGAQISDGDRKFVSEFTGDLATDPFALKRMLAIRIAGQIKRVNQHNKQAAAFGRTADDPNFESVAGTPLNIQIPDDEVAAMVDNVLQGRATTAGRKQPTAPAGTVKQPIPLDQYLQQLRGGR